MTDCYIECSAEPWDGDGIDRFQPECIHPSHWLSVTCKPDGWLDWDDAPAECRWAQVHQNCELDAGHAGPHQWPGLKQFVKVLEPLPSACTRSDCESDRAATGECHCSVYGGQQKVREWAT